MQVQRGLETVAAVVARAGGDPDAARMRRECDCQPGDRLAGAPHQRVYGQLSEGHPLERTRRRDVVQRQACGGTSDHLHRVCRVGRGHRLWFTAGSSPSQRRGVATMFKRIVGVAFAALANIAMGAFTGAARAQQFLRIDTGGTACTWLYLLPGGRNDRQCRIAAGQDRRHRAGQQRVGGQHQRHRRRRARIGLLARRRRDLGAGRHRHVRRQAARARSGPDRQPVPRERAHRRSPGPGCEDTGQPPRRARRARLGNADQRALNIAFRLGLAKALVPFVFVFSPSLLLVAKGFNGYDFTVTAASSASDAGGGTSKFLLVEATITTRVRCDMARCRSRTCGRQRHRRASAPIRTPMPSRSSRDPG